MFSSFVFSQEDRLPISISSSLAIPVVTSNQDFNNSSTGNLDWKSDFNYVIKKRHQISISYKRSNFKLGSLENKFNTDLKSKCVISSYGIGYSYYLSNSEKYAVIVGLNAYAANSVFKDIVVDSLPQKNISIQHFLYEPNFTIVYKASEYIDLAFTLSENLTNFRFNPIELNLERSTLGVTYDAKNLSLSPVSFLSFGFKMNWYLQFEKSE